MTFISSDKQPVCSLLTACYQDMHEAMQSKLDFSPYNTLLHDFLCLNVDSALIS